MAVTNLVITNDSDKHKVITKCYGDGAPASTDKLVTDVKTFPKGSEYFDCTNKKPYVRIAVAGVTGDFVSTTAYA